jgi:hypothetical protein
MPNESQVGMPFTPFNHPFPSLSLIDANGLQGLILIIAFRFFVPFISYQHSGIRIDIIVSSSSAQERMSAAIEVESTPNVRPSSPFTSHSSPILRSSQSASSQSFGSSLDTASASAHLERYETPWSVAEMAVFRRGERSRVRSFSAVVDWNNVAPNGRHHLIRNCRPLAGTSRKRLISQIHQLSKDKADLEAQLAAIVRGEVPPAVGPSESSSRGVASSTKHLGSDDIMRSLSPMTLSDDSLEASSPASLEHISTLAAQLRDALETSTTHLLDEESARLLERPGMKALLLMKPPNVERAQLHARFFAQRL